MFAGCRVARQVRQQRADPASHESTSFCTPATSGRGGIVVGREVEGVVIVEVVVAVDGCASRRRQATRVEADDVEAVADRAREPTGGVGGRTTRRTRRATRVHEQGADPVARVTPCRHPEQAQAHGPGVGVDLVERDGEASRTAPCRTASSSAPHPCPSGPAPPSPSGSSSRPRRGGPRPRRGQRRPLQQWRPGGRCSGWPSPRSVEVPWRAPAAAPGRRRGKGRWLAQLDPGSRPWHSLDVSCSSRSRSG